MFNIKITNVLMINIFLVKIISIGHGKTKGQEIMKENISMSENLNELFTALSKAQGKIQPACKDKSNPFFKSKYADLSSVWDACRDPLSENGLSVVQFPQNKPEGLFLISILGHSSGQWMKSEIHIPLAKNDPQSVGSALTYFRRYSLSALVGVSPEDDDGEKAQAPYRQKQMEQKTVSIQPVSQKINKQQSDELNKILSQCEEKYVSRVYDHIKRKYYVDDICDLPLDRFEIMKIDAIKNIKIDECIAEFFAVEV